MKLKLFLSLSVMIFAFATANASFPVKRAATTADTEVKADVTEAEVYSPAAATMAYDKWVAVALWFFLGWPFAAHRWYAGKPAGWNILFILTIAGLGVWGIVDLVNILTDNFQ